MNKFTLSKPQRLLIVLGIAVFVIGMMWMGYFIFKGITRELNRGIQIDFASSAPIDSTGPQARNLAFGELITQPIGESLLSWNDHKLAVFGPATLVINPASVELQSGFVYLENGNDVEITINSQRLKLAGVSGLYDTSIRGFIVTAGEMNVNTQEIAKPNNIILFDGTKFTTSTFDRSELKSAKWNRVLNLLAAKSQLPQALADLIPPEIANLTPADNSETTESQLTIKGETEPDATLRVEGREITLNTDGSFSIKYDLPIGLSALNITASDLAGNQSSVVLHYSRRAATSNCSQIQFAAQMLCLINNYRQDNQLEKLVLNSSLTSAAQSHSDWMSANQTLSHNGENGSTPFSRCNDVGATCTAENIAMQLNSTAQNIFTLWQNSPPDNTNLLGQYTEIGIGIAGSYVVTVFH